MKKIQRLLPVALLGAAPSFILASAAHASLYVNQIGPNISYTDINEFDSQSSGPPPVNSTPIGLFGQPVLSPAGSDNLSFPASTFDALAADGQYEFQDGKLTLDISPTLTTGSIESLVFDEGGGFRDIGSAAVEATLLFNDLRITSVNDVPLTTPIVVVPTFSESITPQSGTATTTTAPGDVLAETTNGDTAGIWDITASFDLSAALAAADKTGNITGVSVALDDQLLADTTVATQSGLSLAEIDKKHIIITGTTTPAGPAVPEPASLSLLVGAAALGMRRRRRI
jgi:hypothetical protein